MPRLAEERLGLVVLLDDESRNGGEEIGDGFHRLDHAEGLTERDARSDVGKLDEDDVAELLLSEVGDADHDPVFVAYLDAKGVHYENRDVEGDAGYRDELIRKTGKTSIPVVEIDGTLIRGYNPKKIPMETI